MTPVFERHVGMADFVGVVRTLTLGGGTPLLVEASATWVGALVAIVNAARHALTHVELVRKDAQRLEKRTGCCMPTAQQIEGLACCSDRILIVGSDVTADRRSV